MRKISLLLVAVVTLSSASLIAQNKKDNLLTIDQNPVTAKEFARVYKKNLELVNDESQKDVDAYLDMFIDYKLKVAEAYDQKLNEKPSFKKEFKQYQDQLSRKYIYDKKVAEDLAKEAFERSLEDVNVDHILIKSDYGDAPKDTLTAYNYLETIRKKALAGEDFTELAKKFSQEPNADKSGGKLGWFSALRMVYPFETAAYNTSVGEVSPIVRTRFGYHILKVNDRRKRDPEITVSHIMLSTKSGERTFEPEERIKEIYNLLQQGESFENLAEQYSDDRNSAKNGGKLQRFGRGDLRAKKFEERAFQIKNEGDITEPFQSEYGWHIIRLDEKHGLPTFEEKKDELLKAVETGERQSIIDAAVTDKIIQKYGYKEGTSYKGFFKTYLPEDAYKAKWEAENIAPADNKTLFTIGDKNATFNGFATYIEENKNSYRAKNNDDLLEKMYGAFKQEILLNYYKEKLEDENEEYAAVITEYRDGLLIFDLMEQNIWNKAKTDSVGLQNFYETIKEDYKWKERIDAIVVSANTEDVAKQAQKMLKEGQTVDALKNEINKDKKTNAIISSGKFEAGAREIPEGFQFKTGVSEIKKQGDKFVVLKVNEVIPPTLKSLDDIRGKVMSGYQDYLEKQWMESLHKKHKVTVNKKVLKKVKKELE